jgi:hypothetical protein
MSHDIYFLMVGQEGGDRKENVQQVWYRQNDETEARTKRRKNSKYNKINLKESREARGARALVREKN